MQESFGLYIHIPFCRKICHYCDFTKTALFDDKIVAQYFQTLNAHLQAWSEKLRPQKISSVFFGGGTPGLFCHEYETLLTQVAEVSTETCEISLEANPEDISDDKVAGWRALGFNRISIGVQSFQASGLKALTRDHTSEKLIPALAVVQKHFTNFNIDLIYGWQEQSVRDWESDLAMAVDMAIPHLSLYNLTYEPRTVIGRKLKRKVLAALNDDLLWQFYSVAMERLSQAGYKHEEVSNWAKPDYSCAHNWLYWQNKFYLGIGCGAHGYLPSNDSKVGERFIYPTTLRAFINSSPECRQIEKRTSDHWLMEYVGSSLRSARGVDLRLAEKWSEREFILDRKFSDYMQAGYISLTAGRIVLQPQEWFRENFWCLQVLERFR